ncbi:MAG: DUF3768 domain-containing protein [Sphingomonadales bacterium]|nr:DUF3768 domain-containing protein [Sphingomonadales bacterium]
MIRREERDIAQSTITIRDLNDRLRQHGEGGRIMLTRAVAAQPPDRISAILAAVQRFDAFTSANDPWGEHDFGQVQIEGKRYFWKIDAYDLNMEFGSPDPADESLTRRVMTIMTDGGL